MAGECQWKELDDGLEELLMKARELLAKRRGGMGNKREVGLAEHGPTKRRWSSQEAEVVEQQLKHGKLRGGPPAAYTMARD
ncbi:hypothetical protein NDU88_001925 [Pleurodeles waltl]|uniref:Uncharacterized protein n=1 Tax=Pleurodeles waltl TaxID=8319 RepID=A0AAV7M100_PLEWA|nr:hypothetical protein NDU88_001925 [Pleurodeles waltl]